MRPKAISAVSNVIAAWKRRNVQERVEHRVKVAFWVRMRTVRAQTAKKERSLEER